MPTRRDRIPRLALTDKVVLTIAEAAGIADVGLTTLYKAVGAGQLVAKKRGRRTIILREDLDRWLKDLPRYEGGKRVVETEGGSEKPAIGGHISR